MENVKKTTKSSKKRSLSKAEYRVVETLESNNITLFNTPLLEKILNWKKSKIYQTIHSMKKKGFVGEIKKGMYILTFSSEPDVLRFSYKIIWPSYISFWTALSYYKFTEQLPNTIFLITTKKREKIEFHGRKILFTKFSPKRFFGYEKIGDVVIADKEKSLIDSFLFPRYAGGIIEVFKCLYNAWSEIDKNILVKYALKMDNKSLLKRLGYLIEVGELKIENELLRKLSSKIGKGYSKLDPQFKKKGDYSKKWGLIVNIDKKRLFEWRAIV